MKICPKCGKTYTDASLNFCLDDGTVLTQDQSGFDSGLPETVMINQPRQTQSNQQFGGQTENQNWAVPTNVSPAAKKGSKTWLWVVGILGVLILLCGGGFAGLVILGSMSENDPKWNSNFGTNSGNNNSTVTNTKSNSISDSRTDISKIDLSAWVQKNSNYGVTEFRGNEFFMNAKKNNFYYVLVASATYKSADATTKLTLRDVESGNNSLGYGLIVNSNPVPLNQGLRFFDQYENSQIPRRQPYARKRTNGRQLERFDGDQKRKSGKCFGSCRTLAGNSSFISTANWSKL